MKAEESGEEPGSKWENCFFLAIIGIHVCV